MEFSGPLHGPQMRLPVGRTESPSALLNAYKQDALPALNCVITQLFHDPSSVSADDLERAYSIAHHYCSTGLRKVCRQDLIHQATATLDEMRRITQSKDDIGFLQCLSFALINSDTVISSLCTIYRTLDKQTLSSKQSTSIRDQLHDLYRDHFVAEVSVQQRLARILPHLAPVLPASPDDWVSPANLQSLVSGLHEFYPRYMELNVGLFELYIPCLVPVRGLDEERALIRQQLEVLSRCMESPTPTPSPQRLSPTSVQGTAPTRQKRKLAFC